MTKTKVLWYDSTEIWVTKDKVYRVRIENDYDCDSPRSYDNFGTFLTWGSKYHSPDDNEFSDNEVFEDQITEKDHVILPVYRYEHGSLAYNTQGFHCRWDSGQCGYIYATKKDAIKEFGKKNFTKTVKERALACLVSEVETYSNWANGQCYGYVVDVAELEVVLDNLISVEAFNTLSDKEKIEFWENVTLCDNEPDEIVFEGYESCWGFIESESMHETYCYKAALETF